MYQPPDDGRRGGSSVPYAEVNAHSADGFLDGASIAGIPVLSTTANPPGKELLLDTSKVGYAGVREALSMRIGYTDDDFTRNIVRTVAEERLVLCVTRPAAALAILNLPTS